MAQTTQTPDLLPPAVLTSQPTRKKTVLTSSTQCKPSSLNFSGSTVKCWKLKESKSGDIITPGKWAVPQGIFTSPMPIRSLVLELTFGTHNLSVWSHDCAVGWVVALKKTCPNPNPQYCAWDPIRTHFRSWDEITLNYLGLSILNPGTGVLTRDSGEDREERP